MARKKKKVSKKKVAKKKTSKALVSWKDKLAALAEQESDRTTVLGGGNSIRLGKGAFKHQGSDLGDVLEVVVVDFVKLKNYYDRPFDEDNPSPPACFALSIDGKNMEPHETAPDPQCDNCNDCWANEFASDKREKGKACRDSYLLGIVPADELGNDEIDVAYLSVPPTSLANWDGYMVKRNKVMHLPALAFITEITFDEEVDYQKLIFAETGRVDERAFEKLFELRETVHEVLMTPTDVTNYEPPTKGKKKKKKVAKKKKTTKKKAKKKKSRF